MTAAEQSLIAPDAARRGAEAALLARGAASETAADTADALVRASLRGIDSHGVDLLPRILKRAEAGRCQLTRPCAEIAGRGAAGVLDAALAPGQHAGMAMARSALARARAHGAGMVCVRNSTHFGAAAPYVELITESGMAAFVGSNSAPSMAAFGAGFANMGNNPLGFGAPSADGGGLIADFSCGVMSFGRLAALRAEGRPVPEDAFVRPSETPPHAPVYEIAGGLEWAALPFGGRKGASVAALVEIFAGVLSGGFFGMQTETMDGGAFRGPGHFALALDPAAFGGVDLPARTAQYAADVRQGRDFIRLPGDNAAAVRRERLREGLPVSADTRALLAAAPAA